MRPYPKNYAHGEHQPHLELHADYLADREPKDWEGPVGQVEEVRDGVQAFHRIAQTIHRAIPSITLDQAKDAAHALLEEARQRSRRSRQ